MSEKRENGNMSIRPGRGGAHVRNIGMPVQKAKNFKETLKRLLKYIAPHRALLLLALVMAALGTLFSIMGPKIMALATDSLYGTFKMRMSGANAAVDYGYIRKILTLLAGLYILSFVFGYLMQYIMAGVSQRTIYTMRNQVSEKLSRLPLSYYDSNSYGDIMSRISNDVDNISSTLQQSISQMFSSIVTIAGIVVMMLLISPLLAAIALVTLPLSIFITREIAKRSQKLFKEQQKVLGGLNGHIEEMYSGHRIVKAFNYEEKSQVKFDEMNERLYESGYRAQFISGLIMPLTNFAGNIGFVLICAAGGLMVSAGSISLGGIQAFIQYSRQFSHPIVQIASIANIIQSAVASAERVFELLDENEEPADGAGCLDKNNVLGDFEFENVSFSYKKNEPLIKNLNISIRAGQTVAIVGPTGAGKTTLVNLVMRFYDVDGGRIAIDGRDIRDISRGSLRGNFGMVLQDTWLFSGTIRENIAYGRPGATDGEIEAAARAAHADHFIMAFPQGYETLLNEEADNISQGQRQLLTIARAILANPQILILDEATSSVDTRTEKHIQRAAEALMKGRTSFVIAHRLSTIVDADVILVMDNGDIIEHGTHCELMYKDGFYAQLYNSQFAGARAGALGIGDQKTAKECQPM